jgi:hypothetical protein
MNSLSLFEPKAHRGTLHQYVSSSYLLQHG